MIEEQIIKRWLNQRCIGYQRKFGGALASVIQGQVELENGIIRDAWIIMPPPTPYQSENGSFGFTFGQGRETFFPPPIDIPA